MQGISVIRFDDPAWAAAASVRESHRFHLIRRKYAMAGSDPFTASIIPFEVPEQMRAFAEKGVSQARDNYAKFKDVAESHNGTIEAVFSTASKGASEYSAKLMEIMKTNTTASLDFAQALIGVKSPSEAMELWSSHAKSQFETFTANAKELAELAKKVATDTAEPIKASASKLFQPAA
jgi:phasin